MAILAACASNPDKAYDIAEAKAEYLDQYYRVKALCEDAGGSIVFRGLRRPMRGKDAVPELGTSYFCVK